jgi:hypothetical protein
LHVCFYIAHFCRFHQIFQCHTVITSHSLIKAFAADRNRIARLDSFCYILRSTSSSEFGAGSRQNGHLCSSPPLPSSRL